LGGVEDLAEIQGKGCGRCLVRIIHRGERRDRTQVSRRGAITVISVFAFLGALGGYKIFNRQDAKSAKKEIEFEPNRLSDDLLSHPRQKIKCGFRAEALRRRERQYSSFLSLRASSPLREPLLNFLRDLSVL